MKKPPARLDGYRIGFYNFHPYEENDLTNTTHSR